mgnify:FL=1
MVNPECHLCGNFAEAHSDCSRTLWCRPDKHTWNLTTDFYIDPMLHVGSLEFELVTLFAL